MERILLVQTHWLFLLFEPLHVWVLQSSSWSPPAGHKGYLLIVGGGFGKGERVHILRAVDSWWDSIHINGSFSTLELFSLPFHLHGICWIDSRSWLDSLVFRPKGSSAKSYTPSLIQPSINCKQLKREHRGSSTRHASCEEEVEWTPISFNTSLLSLQPPYCFNINWETVHCSKSPLLFSILNEVERKLFFKALHHIIYTRWQLVVPWQGVQLQSSG